MGEDRGPRLTAGAASVPTSPPGATLRRTLSLRDLVVFGLLFIGPLAPVSVFGVLDARTNGAVALVYLLATVAMAFTAWSYAEMSRVVPAAGSVFAYAREALGPRAGFVAGWMAMLDYLLIPSVAYLFSGIALHALVPAVPAWIFTVVAFLVTTALNLAGIRAAARVGRVVLVAEIVVLVIFVGVSLAAITEHGLARPALSPFTGLDSFAWTPVVGAVSIAVLSFLGFDAIASFAEENAGEARHVGRAILSCLAIAGVIFVLQAYLAAVVSPIDPEDLAQHPERQGTAFFDITRAALAPWLATTVALAKAIGPAFAAMTAQAAAARLLYGMARSGSLPGALAEVDPRTGTPRVALVTAAILTLGVAVWAARRSDGLSVLVSIVDVGALAAFGLLHASVPAFFFRDDAPRRWVRHGLVPVAGAIVTIWVIAEAAPLAQAVGLVWLVAGLGLALGQSRVPALPLGASRDV